MIEDPRADALRALVRAHAPLMRWLRAARACATGLDWCIGAGAVRALVWNHLHGLPAGSHAPADVDFVYFDPADLSSASETGLAARLRARRRRTRPGKWSIRRACICGAAMASASRPHRIAGSRHRRLA